MKAAHGGLVVWSIFPMVADRTRCMIGGYDVLLRLLREN